MLLDIPFLNIWGCGNINVLASCHPDFGCMFPGGERIRYFFNSHVTFVQHVGSHLNVYNIPILVLYSIIYNYRTKKRIEKQGERSLMCYKQNGCYDPIPTPADKVIQWIHQVQSGCEHRTELSGDIEICNHPCNKTAGCHQHCCPRKREVKPNE